MQALEKLRKDDKGAVSLEYVIVLGTVGIGSAAAFITLGVAFVKSFEFVRFLLLCPFP
jgi:Flp pilus assembly pilin Flp